MQGHLQPEELTENWIYETQGRSQAQGLVCSASQDFQVSSQLYLPISFMVHGQ